MLSWVLKERLEPWELAIFLSNVLPWGFLQPFCVSSTECWLCEHISCWRELFRLIHFLSRLLPLASVFKILCPVLKMLPPRQFVFAIISLPASVPLKFSKSTSSTALLSFKIFSLGPKADNLGNPWICLWQKEPIQGQKNKIKTEEL